MSDPNSALSLRDVSAVPAAGGSTERGSGNDVNNTSYTGVFNSSSADNQASRAVVLADGDVSRADGDVAAQVTAESVAHALWSDIPSADPRGAIRRAVFAANVSLRHHVHAEAEVMEDCRTGLLVGVFTDHTIHIESIGDGQAYHVPADGSNPDKLTGGNSATVPFEDSGVASTGMYGRALMPENDFGRIVFCSEGVSGPMSKSEVGRVVNDSATPTGAASTLVDRATVTDGSDDATAVVVNVDWQSG